MALFSVIKLSWLLYSLTLLKDNYHIVVPFCIIVYDCFGGHQTPPMVSLRNSSSICHPILHASSPLWLPIQTSEAANRLYIIFIDFCPNLLKFTKKMAEVLRSLAYMLSFLVFYKSMWFTKKKMIYINQLWKHSHWVDQAVSLKDYYFSKVKKKTLVSILDLAFQQ